MLGNTNVVGALTFDDINLNVSFEYEGEHGSALYNGSWTADFDGIGVIFASWTSSGASSWWYVKDNTIDVVVGTLASAANQLTNSTSFPIIKGHTYSSSDKRNVSTARFHCFRIKATQPAVVTAGTIYNLQEQQTLSCTALTNKISDVDGFSAIVVGNLLFVSGFFKIDTVLSSNEDVLAIGTGSGVRVIGRPFVVGASGDNTVAPFSLDNDNQNDRLILRIYWGAGRVNYWNFSTCIPIIFV